MYPLLLLPLLTLTSASCPPVETCLASLKPGSDCPNLLPVPERSLYRRVAPDSFLLTPLREGVWSFFMSDYISLILRSDRKLVMLDLVAPIGSNVSLPFLGAQEVMNGTTPANIDVVYSHAHFDHIGASTAFVGMVKQKWPKAKLTIWGTKASKQLAQRAKSNRAVAPDVIVGKKGATLRVRKGLKVKMSITGGHTEDDLLLYIPPSGEEQGVVMLVDVAFPRWSPPFNFAIADRFGGVIEQHEEILKLDFGVYVGGHNRLGDRKDVKESLRFFKDVLEAAEEAQNEVDNDKLIEAGIGLPFQPGTVEFGNIWFAFARVLRPLQIDVCYRRVVQKWGCQLAGVDIFGRGLCFTALQFLLVEA